MVLCTNESTQGIIRGVTYEVVHYIYLHEVSYLALIFTLSVSYAHIALYIKY